MANARYKNINEQRATLTIVPTSQNVAYGEVVELPTEIGDALSPGQFERLEGKKAEAK